jgi:type I restriction enzyme, S subunit
MSDLPPGWEWATLGELVDVLDHKRVPVSAQEREHRKGNVPYYGAAGQVGWIDQKIFDEDLILLGEDGVQFFDQYKPKAYSVSGPSWVNNHAHVLRSHPRIAMRYLLHYLNYFDYHGYVTGTTRLKLTKSQMAAIPVPAPPFREQQRIVSALEDHLSLLDAGVSVLAVVSRRLARLRDHTIRAGCNGSLTSSMGRVGARLPGVGLHDGELPPIPSTWRWGRLHEVADVVGGITKDAKRQSDASLDEVPYLRVANVQRGRIDLTNVATIRAPRNKIEQLVLRPGDVLLNEGGDRDKLARGWVWEGQIPVCIHQNHVFRARVRDGILDPRILAWHANSFGKAWAEANGKQSVNLASISLSKIRLMPVPIPPTDEQQEIVRAIEGQIDRADRLSQSISTAARRTNQLRQSVLAEAFTGRLVPQDSSDEPASVLLERIRAERTARPKGRHGGARNNIQETLL